MVRRSGYDPATGKRWPRDDEKENLRAENERLRAALRQFVACCETAPPVSLMAELGMACKAAKEALES